MSRAVVVRQTGGPEVLRLEEREVAAPGPGWVRLRHEAIGVNFIDVYHRTGLYPVDLPFVPGIDGVGLVTAVGEGAGHEIGDRVAYAGSLGAYAQERLVAADRLVSVPEGIAAEVAVSLLTKGGTAHYLLFETWQLQPSDTILVHAAAGGVGSLLVQWAAARGATVIALAGSDEKCAAARAAGARHAFSSRGNDWVAAVREVTDGRGVDVVFDGVGQASFSGSLDCLRPRGLMVSYGNASGPVGVPDLGVLARKGSLYVTRPTSADYFGDAAGVRRTMDAVFAAALAGTIRPAVNHRFALAEAAAAHRALESRRTSGACVLVP